MQNLFSNLQHLFKHFWHPVQHSHNVKTNLQWKRLKESPAEQGFTVRQHFMCIHPPWNWLHTILLSKYASWTLANFIIGGNVTRCNFCLLHKAFNINMNCWWTALHFFQITSSCDLSGSRLAFIYLFLKGKNGFSCTQLIESVLFLNAKFFYGPLIACCRINGTLC